MSNFVSSHFARPARGFNLIELMVAVAIAAILLGIAVPSFRGTSINTTMVGLNNRLIYALNFARSEAVRRGVAVEVLAVNGNASWSQGWSVIADTAFDSTFATTINTEAAVPVTYTVCGAATCSATHDRIIFSPAGVLVGPTTGFDINVNRPDANKPLSRRISVQGSGAITTRSNTTGSPAPFSC
jgi:type IV fimbrial biogenesis protein FimT